MKIEHIQVYGSAGGVERKGDITAHLVLSQCDTVEAVRQQLAASDDLVEALLTALPFVEDAGADPAYKPRSVSEAIRKIRAALSKAGAI
jgi:hypothetical protein